MAWRCYQLSRTSCSARRKSCYVSEVIFCVLVGERRGGATAREGFGSAYTFMFSPCREESHGLTLLKVNGTSDEHPARLAMIWCKGAIVCHSHDTDGVDAAFSIALPHPSSFQYMTGHNFFFFSLISSYTKPYHTLPYWITANLIIPSRRRPTGNPPCSSLTSFARPAQAELCGR